MPTIDDVIPDKATYLPGEAVRVRIALSNDVDTALRGRLTLALSHLNETVAEFEQQVELQPRSKTALSFSLTPPATPLRGYGLEATLYNQAGSILAEGSGALDVLERWSQAPRYGFLSDFGPDQTEDEVATRADSLCRYHLNVVQFYDWMWRHYKLLPPAEVGEEFTDALNRRLSLRSVRAAIEGVQARGGAAMAYGAVYGAEPEFAGQHPELMLYDEAGQPVSLAQLFYIMNIAPGSPWVDLIVAELADAVRELDFDGIHMDQYGFPKTALSATGEIVDLAVCFPPLIDRARASVVAEKSGAGVIFNAVENWPIETVARTSQDVVYIEVWPPYESYDDLRQLIREGKRLSGGKQVILAAYLSPFLDAAEETLPQAEAAALLATATIGASGGSHLLVGERDGVLCDPYYPKYATLRPSFAVKMRAYYDFLVRYEELFIALDLEDWNLGNEEGVLGRDGQLPLRAENMRENMRVSIEAEAGTIWAVTRQKPGYRIAHLINLLDQSDVAWNAPHTPSKSFDNIELALTLEGSQRTVGEPVREVLYLSPDSNYGRPTRMEWLQQGDQLRVRVPQLHVWGVIVCVLREEG